MALTRPRRPDRPGAAVGPGDRPRQRAAAAAAVLAAATSTRIVGIDNHRGVFPIHRSVRFLLRHGDARLADAPIACRLGRRRPGGARVDRRRAADASPWFPVRVTPALLERHLRRRPRASRPAQRRSTSRSSSARRRCFRRSAAQPAGRSRFGRELNASDDRGAFRAGRRRPAGRRRQAHRAVSRRARRASRHSISAADARRLLRSDRYERPRLAYRDVASATNRLTLIAAVLPAGCVSTHTVFCLRTPLPLARSAFSLRPVQQLRRQLPRPPARDDARDDGDGRAAADPDHRGRAGRVPGNRRARAACCRAAPIRPRSRRLNARVAELYQLSAEEFEHILATFPADPARTSGRGAETLPLRDTEMSEDTEMDNHRDTETQR